MRFFDATKLTPSTIIITDLTGVHCFLVRGTRRALLIDCGAGVGDLAGFARQQTTLPISLLLTHGHCDHAGGAAFFDTAYLSEADWNLASRHDTLSMKKDYARYTCSELFSSLTQEDFCPPRHRGYLPLNDGTRFDLGGISLEAIAVPGHTQGMTCVLNQTERSILFGDACNPCVFLWDADASSVEAYWHSLQHLRERESEYDTVYLSHGARCAPKSILDEVLLVCEEILQGKDDKEAFSFMEHRDLLMAKSTLAGRRADGKLGNIVYNPARIRNADIAGELKR